MRSWGGAGLVAVFLLLGAGAVLGQEAAPTAPATQVSTTMLQEKVTDVRPDLVAPELAPKERTINTAEPCKETIDGVVDLSLVVDVNGEPRNVSVVNPKAISLEKLAVHVVGEDTFKPGTLNGEAVAVKQSVQVKIEACIATKTYASGGTADVLRLTAQPVQTFSGLSVATKDEAHGGSGDEVEKNLGLYRVGNGVSAPIVLNSVEAEFPNEALERKYGMCLISVIVGVDGKPTNLRVVRSLGADMDQKAIEAVNRYRFKPAMKDQKPVRVQITVEVNFRP
jgi:TonB family protein